MLEIQSLHPGLVAAFSSETKGNTPDKWLHHRPIMYPHMITVVEMRNMMIINRSITPAAITPINMGRGSEVSAFGRKERIPPPLSCVGGKGVDNGRSDADGGVGVIPVIIFPVAR